MNGNGGWIRRSWLCLGGILLVSGFLMAQDTLHSPLSIPLRFSGNFGEIRTGHFHTGMDIRTGGVEGVPVLASQTGRISRVKVSDAGYGLALYLDGRGLTTVYAHLSRFHPDIEAWLRETQYANERWAFDGPPTATFSFNAGDTIGWSGNSGRSFGPHLHFEVRDQRTQWPINPLHWTLVGEGMTHDDVPPEFRAVWVLPVGGAMAEGARERFRWSPAYGETVRVAGPFRLGVEAFDKLDGEAFTHGPYGLDVFLNDSLIHRHRMDTLDFSTNKDVSAHIDIAAWQDRRTRVHRLHRLPGNRLDIYQRTGDMDPLVVAPGDTARLDVVVLDLMDNASRASVLLVGDSLPGDSVAPEVLLDHRRRHRLTHGRMGIEVPPGALYGDAAIELLDDSTGRFAVRSEARVTRSAYQLNVPVPAAWNGSGEPLVLCGLDDEGEVDGTWVADERGGMIGAKVKQFGLFEVRPDTVPPALGTPQVKEGTLRLSIADDLSGVERWEGRCDGRWMRFGWEKGVLVHPIEDGILTEGSEIKVWAVDEVGNLGHREFTWPLK